MGPAELPGLNPDREVAQARNTLPQPTATIAAAIRRGLPIIPIGNSLPPMHLRTGEGGTDMTENGRPDQIADRSRRTRRQLLAGGAAAVGAMAATSLARGTPA